MASAGASETTRGRRAVWLGTATGLLLSLLAVLALLYGAYRVAGYFHKNETRALFATLQPFPAATLTRTDERWENLPLYWQSEGVLPRVIHYYRSESSTGEVVTFYRQQLLAAGWEEYKEPWSLYPAYRKGKFRLAILFQQAYPQEWVPAGDYQVHLWSYPLLEGFLGRDLAR